MSVNLGVGVGGRSVESRLFYGEGVGHQNVDVVAVGDFSFKASLKKTIVPEYSDPNTVISFARADGADRRATITDWENLIKSVKAGEARFLNARRVENLWTTSSVTLANTANKSLTLTAGDYVFSMGAGTGTATFSGTGGATGTLGASASARVSVLKTITAGTFVVTASVADLVDLQVELVSGQADQSAGPYVSVGVASAPAYHGAGVDGVEYFDTEPEGTPLAGCEYLAEGSRGNLCLQSNAFTTTWTANNAPAITQNAIGPDGATSAWTLTDSAGTVASISQAIALTAANHTLSVFVKKTSGAQSSYPIFLVYDGGTKAAACTVDTSNGVATAWTAYTGLTIVTSSASCVSHNDDFWRVSLVFLATAASWTVYLEPAGTANATQSTGVESGAAQGSAVFCNAQVELGSFASTYIPTTTAAVTRASDVDSDTTAGNLVAAAGSILLTFTPQHAPSGTIALWGTYVDASNYTAILHDATNMIFRKRIAGVNYDATLANAFVSGTAYKVAATWGAGGTSLHVNGVAGTPHANTTAAQIAATMQWGADGNGAQQPFATIGDARTWQRQLSTSEAAAISS